MPARLTAQDQRAYIAISVASNVPCIDVVRTLRKAIDKRNIYSQRQIQKLYKEFKDKKRPDTSDQRCNSGRSLSHR